MLTLLGGEAVLTALLGRGFLLTRLWFSKLGSLAGASYCSSLLPVLGDLAAPAAWRNIPLLTSIVIGRQSLNTANQAGALLCRTAARG